MNRLQGCISSPHFGRAWHSLLFGEETNSWTTANQSKSKVDHCRRWLVCPAPMQLYLKHAETWSKRFKSSIEQSIFECLLICCGSTQNDINFQSIMLKGGVNDLTVAPHLCTCGAYVTWRCVRIDNQPECLVPSNHSPFHIYWFEQSIINNLNRNSALIWRDQFSILSKSVAAWCVSLPTQVIRRKLLPEAHIILHILELSFVEILVVLLRP